MKAKRVLKVTGKIILVILILIIVVLIITSVLFRLRVNKAKDYLKNNSYYNLVSAGDYNVNVFTCGNENGKHTIVALAGYLDGEMYIGWRKMTTPLEEDNKLVFDADINTFTIGNTPGTALPQTGGIGTTLFTALGGLMTATAGAILTIKRKRKTA